MNRSAFRVLLVVLFLLLAGCSSSTAPTSPTPTTNPSPTPTATPTPSPTVTQSPSPTPTSTQTPTVTPQGPQYGDEWTVTITRVIDGDTVEAEFPNGEIDTLRLLGVDTPETTYSRVSPDEFEGIPDTTAGRDHLFNWGEQASTFAVEELAGKQVRISVDPEADRRGSFGRLLVYIYLNDENFNQRLLAEGYARVYESSFTLREEFEHTEATAQANNIGLWDFSAQTPTPTATPDGGSTGELVVETIHADAEGNDHENENDEYIVFKNDGDSTLEMGGWTIADEADHTYIVPSGFSLGPGDSVTLYTGSGMNSDSELYWGSDAAIWNNAGDTIIVRDDQGNLVLENEY